MKRRPPSLSALLRWAIAYVERENDSWREWQLNPATKRVEPYSVRREVDAADRWLQQARAALDQGDHKLSRKARSALRLRKEFGA